MALSAIIVAAGAGTRLGARIPKGFVTVGGKRLFLYSLETMLRHRAIADAVVVVPKGYEQKAQRAITASNIDKRVTVVAGGKERWQSVLNGVNAAQAEWVLVHDAARPFVTKAVIDALLRKKKQYRCAITATPVVDTIRTAQGTLAGAIIDRTTLVRVGTPQLHLRNTLLKALQKAPSLSSPPTDEAALMQQIGVRVAIAPGDPMNFKITTKADLAIAEALIAQRQ
jgi:2-C-methyl-D-erythritol 4-phosphate cytidylyltransferase